MSSFTFRIAHLKRTPLKAGDSIHRGDVIGEMGNTGQSTGPHAHIDVVKGTPDRLYRLMDLAEGNPEPDFEELHYFIDKELTGGYSFEVTTYPYDYRYVIKGKWKPHPGYDLVVRSDPPLFYWNRSFTGVVLTSAYDSGYGRYLQIAYYKE